MRHLGIKRLPSSFHIQRTINNIRKFNNSSASKIIDEKFKLIFNKEINDALIKQKPIIALESTIICHGMPYPQNLDTALEVERIVRQNGSAPATIAILNGRIHVGLESKDLEKLAKMGKSVKKCSRRDLALAVSQGLTGATTVAGTMAIAHMAGIKVFVTGGIGGVHRDAETTMDISADLTELGRTPVAVICAGVKSILDIEKTLEYLETQGVLVSTFVENRNGNGDDDFEFPAFFTRKSGFKSPSSLKTIKECASLIYYNSLLNLQSGLVIAVPIPEKNAADAELIQVAIENALMAARNIGVSGKEVTPFLLKRVNEQTQGASLKANIALVKNNAIIGSQIAKCLAEDFNCSHENRENYIDTHHPINDMKQEQPTQQNKLVVIGGIAVDIVSTLDPKFKDYHRTSSPGKIRFSLGGVGRNIAEAASRIGVSPLFISSIGRDIPGTWLLNKMKEIGMATEGLQILDEKPTGVYNAVHDPYGDLLYAVADMDFDNISGDLISEAIKKNKPNLVCFDGNVSTTCITSIIETCQALQIPVFFEPTSVPKSKKIVMHFRSLLPTNIIRYTSPNKLELAALHNEAEALGLFDYEAYSQDLTDVEKVIGKSNEKLSLLNEEIFFQSARLLPYIPNIIVTLGNQGALLVQSLADPPLIRDESKFRGNNFEIIVPKRVREDGRGGGAIRFRYFEPTVVENEEVVNVTGAGDSFAGALAAGLSYYGDKPIDDLIDGAQKAAALTLQSHETVSEKITPKLLAL
ncbi:13773_t:CDS:10 [Ambispora leptoticha]|uniref:13773_t:CDS:1 n=1 Tax=Ambispora leptoticha TaxID=144679 RepID=A0A9N9CNS3_9GLOM|nr:13773_t:CDS:10 [Ambispora leptoticha]